MTAILYHQITSLNSMDFANSSHLKNNTWVEDAMARQIVNRKEADLKN